MMSFSRLSRVSSSTSVYASELISSFPFPLSFSRGEESANPSGVVSLSVLVSLMREKRNEKSYLLFIYHVLVLFLLHLVRWTPFIDAYTRLSSLFFSPFPIFSFPNVIIFFSVLFVSWFLGSSIQIDIVFLKFLELRRIEGHFISKKLVRFERMNKLKPGNSKSSDLSLKTGSR